MLGIERAELIASRLGISPLRSWYFHALKETSLRGWQPNYYEFGVGWGETLSKYVSALLQFRRLTGVALPSCHVTLFDSFQGLPRSTDPRDVHSDWPEGRFAHSVPELSRLISRLGLEPDSRSVEFISGFFEDSLTAALRDTMTDHPPAIVTVDVDLYTSTSVVLGWLRPILREGTLVYFDDIFSFGGDPDRGELAAIRDFNARGPGRLSVTPRPRGLRTVYAQTYRYELQSKAEYSSD